MKARQSINVLGGLSISQFDPRIELITPQIKHLAICRKCTSAGTIR